MKNLSKFTLVIALAVIVTALTAQSVSACEGYGKGMFKDGQGKRGAHSMFKGARGENSLIPEEMRAQFKAEWENMSDEERAQKKEEMRAMRQEMREQKRAQMEEFTGLTHDELRQARHDGKTMGVILEEQGLTQADAEEFLTDRANEKVDNIVEIHDLSAEDEQTLRDRIANWIQGVLNRWFNNA